MERLTQLRSRFVQILFVCLLCFFAFWRFFLSRSTISRFTKPIRRKNHIPDIST